MSVLKPFYRFAAILWIVFIVLFVFLVASCSQQTRQAIDERVELGDGKLFGSEAAYDIGVSLAQIALYEKPALAHSAVTKLKNVKNKVVDLEQEYTVNQAADIVGAMLLEECGPYCNTIIGQQYVEKVKLQLDALRALQANDVTVTLQAFLDQLLAQIEAVRRNPIGETDAGA